MKVKEAIELLEESIKTSEMLAEKFKTNRHYNSPEVIAKINNTNKKRKQIISLLKSLEAENKRLKGYEKAWGKLAEEIEESSEKYSYESCYRVLLQDVEFLKQKYLKANKLPEPVQKIADNQKIMDRLGGNNEY